MKKTLKITTLLVITIALLFILTGCGNKNLVATRTFTEDEDGMNMKARVEVSFKKDIADEVKMSMEFDSEETALQYKEYIAEADGSKIDQKGKSVTTTIKASDFAAEENNKEVTKDAMTEYLKNEGFTIEK